MHRPTALRPTTYSTVWRLCALACLLPLAASAQTGVPPALQPRPAEPVERLPGPVLRPGDAVLETGWIASDTATYALRIVEPMRLEIGTATVDVTVSEGRMTTETTIVIPQQRLRQTTVARGDAATLAPLAHMTSGGPAETMLSFAPGRVSGSRTAESVTVPLDFTVAAPVFDDAWTGVVAQSLPLRAGYAVTAEVYDKDRGVQPVTYTVAEQGDEDGRAVWTVRAQTPSGPFTYTVDAETRRLVRMTFVPQPGVVVEMGPPASDAAPERAPVLP